MKLSGKALTDFREYFRKEIPLNDFRGNGFILGIDDFFKLPPAMQCGLFTEFFAEYQIYILPYPYWSEGELTFHWIIEGGPEEKRLAESGYRGFKSITEAVFNSLSKACEIYNHQTTNS